MRAGRRKASDRFCAVRSRGLRTRPAASPNIGLYALGAFLFLALSSQALARTCGDFSLAYDLILTGVKAQAA